MKTEQTDDRERSYSSDDQDTDTDGMRELTILIISTTISLGQPVLVHDNKLRHMHFIHQ